MMHRVFVYGTLKRGYGNNAHFLKDSFYAGQSATPANYLMHSSDFPVILESGEDGMAVAGELYHVNDSTLARLDQLESEGRLYERKVIDVIERGEPVQAYVYVGIEDESMQWRAWPAYRHTNQRGELDWNRHYTPKD